VRESGVVAGPAAALPSREALLIRQLINQPRLLHDYAEEVSTLTLTSVPLMRLRDALLVFQVEDLPLDNTTLRHHLNTLGFGSLVGLIDKANSHKADKFAEPDAEPHEAERGWRHALALHNRQLELKQALQAAQAAWDADLSEESFERLKDINRQLNEATTNEPMS
jgi:DNA primase